MKNLHRFSIRFSSVLCILEYGRVISMANNEHAVFNYQKHHYDGSVKKMPKLVLKRFYAIIYL